MKKVLFVIGSLFLCFTSCSKSLEEKAQELIKNDLFKTLHDFDSYQLVEFSKLDSAFTDLSSVAVLKDLVEEFEEKGAQIKRINESVKFDTEWAERMGDIYLHPKLERR